MLVIDRFEGDFAVVETSSGMVNIPKGDLPSDAREGDLLRLVVDAEGTKNRAKHIKELMNSVWED